MPDKIDYVAKWEERDAKRHEKERKRRRHREAERARRGSPQRFTLTGMQFHRGAHDADSCWTLPSIDPDLEQDEVIEVVEVAALTDCERERDEYAAKCIDWHGQVLALRDSLTDARLRGEQHGRGPLPTS